VVSCEENILEVDLLKIGAYTDKGKKRDENQDSCYIPNNESKINVFIVADGMGGHNAGKIASQEAVKSILEYLSKNYNEILNDKDAVISLIKDSILHANKVLYDKSIQNSEYFGMGTTIAMALVYKHKAYIAHIGDSRIYIMRKDKLTQITRDHSYVEQLIDDGSITREESYKHPKKHMITRALGCEENVEIDIGVKNFFRNDILLICTDGLTAMIDDKEISRIILNWREDIQKTAQQLVNEANIAGGTDNTTVILVENRNSN
jgi:protein phosphatase